MFPGPGVRSGITSFVSGQLNALSLSKRGSHGRQSAVAWLRDESKLNYARIPPQLAEKFRLAVQHCLQDEISSVEEDVLFHWIGYLDRHDLIFTQGDATISLSTLLCIFMLGRVRAYFNTSTKPFSAMVSRCFPLLQRYIRLMGEQRFFRGNNKSHQEFSSVLVDFLLMITTRETQIQHTRSIFLLNGIAAYSGNEGTNMLSLTQDNGLISAVVLLHQADFISSRISPFSCAVANRLISTSNRLQSDLDKVLQTKEASLLDRRNSSRFKPILYVLSDIIDF